MASYFAANQKHGTGLGNTYPTLANDLSPSLCNNCKEMIKAIEDLGPSKFLYGEKTPFWTTSSPPKPLECVLCAHIRAKLPDAAEKLMRKHEARCSSRLHFKRPKPAVITYSVRKAPTLGKGKHNGFELSWDCRFFDGRSPIEIPLELNFMDPRGGLYLVFHFKRPCDEIGVSTSSPQTWHTANQWLKECSARHMSCRLSKFCPTRLIDVGLNENSVIQLRENLDIPFDATYVTLSHCWAGSIPIKAQLLQENHYSLRERIDIANLPKTFTDAITATRKLGLRYLWIDSLCILQNSIGDWSHESRVMGDIYSNGYCNLAATDSPDSAGGLFRQRNPFVAQNWSVNIAMHGTLLPFYLVDYELWDRAVYGAKLNGRGWVYQERFLSPRTIHFGRDQLFWECRERTACELYPGLDSYQIGGTTPWPKVNLEGGRTSARFLEAWRSIVEVYSGTYLTRSTDKLIAISGLATRVWKSVPDDYCAGLWRQGLEDHLIWRRQSSPVSTISFNYDMRKNHKSSNDFVAPSWSWASLEHAVEFASETGKTDSFYSDVDSNMFQIDRIEVDLEDSASPFGAVKSGSLNVSCRLGRVELDTTSPEQMKEVTKMLLNDFRGVYAPTNKSDEENIAKMERRYRDLIDNWEQEGINELYFLPTKYHPLRRRSLSGRESRAIVYQGLVLRKVAGTRNVFSRVGVFDFKYCVYEFYAWWIKLFDDFDQNRDSSDLEYVGNAAAGFTYQIVIV